MSTFGRFLLHRHPPLKYGIYVPLLVSGVLCALAPLRPGHGPSVAGAICGGLAVFTLLFYFRAVDEVKDLDYDRRFKPHRPLVTGEVTVANIRVYLVVSALVALALSAVAGPVPVLLAVGAMLYSLLLFWLEHNVPRFEASMWGNIVITVQLKTILLVYIISLGGPVPVLPSILVVASVLCGYLNWEIARKTIRARFARPAEKLYSTAAGLGGATAVSVALLLAACALQAVVALAWEPPPHTDLLLLLLPLPFTVYGVAKLATTRTRRYAADGAPQLAYLILLATCTTHYLLTAH